MHDTDTGGNDSKAVKCLGSPLQELVARLVALELNLHVALKRIIDLGKVHLDRVVDNKVDGNQGLDDSGVLAHARGGRTHRGKVDQKRNAGKVLKDDPRDNKR